ncbi:MAG: hydroxyisourate hydrolase [Geminicoccaceae bacterium]
MLQERNRRGLLKTSTFAGVAMLTANSVSAQQSPPAKLSTHALDTYLGKQAAGIRIDFSKQDGESWKLIKTLHADNNGRVTEKLLTAETMAVGRYELLFYVQEYYHRVGVDLSNPSYLDTVPVRIAIFDALQSYHVPLYFSPWSFMSYRGS